MAKFVSEETRSKMSEASKGKPKSPAHCAAIKAALTGKPKSPEHVEKLRGRRGPRKKGEPSMKCLRCGKGVWDTDAHKC